MTEKTFTLKMPSVKTVGVFLRNAIATLVILLSVLGSILFVQVHNQQNQLQHEAVVARQVAKAAVDQAVRAQTIANQGTSISLCRSLDDLAALKPPPGDAATNPSRAYEQQQHAILAGLAVDLKCP
jgi:hypothetical protein